MKVGDQIFSSRGFDVFEYRQAIGKAKVLKYIASEHSIAVGQLVHDEVQVHEPHCRVETEFASVGGDQLADQIDADIITQLTEVRRQGLPIDIPCVPQKHQVVSVIDDSLVLF